jgi:transposase InsO family protein
MGIEEVMTAPRSPWQHPYAERMIGTLGRELLDHVIVLNEAHLCRLVQAFLGDYHTVRPPTPTSPTACPSRLAA